MKMSHPIITTPLAHRGLHTAVWDENSLLAFENAIKKGFGIELDVHLMKDGNIAVIHDSSLKRVTGFDVEIESLSVKDLNKYPLLLSKTFVPTLDDVLKIVEGRVPILIELKVVHDFNPIFAEKILEILAQYPFKKNIALQSFNPYAVKFLKKEQDIYPVGQLGSDELPGQSKFVHFMFKHLFILHVSKPDFLNFDIKYIKKKKIARLRRRGLPILAWTIDSQEKKTLAASFADNIIFENINIQR